MQLKIIFFMRTFCLWFFLSKTSSFIKKKVNKSESEIVIIPSLQRSTHMFFIIFNVFLAGTFLLILFFFILRVFKFIYHHHFRMFADFLTSQNSQICLKIRKIFTQKKKVKIPLGKCEIILKKRIKKSSRNDNQSQNTITASAMNCAMQT